MYLDSLKNWGLESWQLHQAQETIWWFLKRFLNVRDIERFERSDGCVAYSKWSEVLDGLQREIRVKQYAMKTEKSYMGWAVRFARFSGERKLELVNPQLLKDLSYSRSSTSVVGSPR